MGEQHQDVGIRTVGIHARPPESESEGVGQQAVLTTASVAYSGARPSLQGSWLRGTGRGQVSNSGALPGAGADGGPAPASSCRAPAVRRPGRHTLRATPARPRPRPARSRPAAPYLSVGRDVMPTRRRSAQGDGSSRGAGREPAQHEQDASHPQAAAPAAPRACSQAARSSSPSGRHLRAGVVSMECDASPPPPALAADRWRALSRLAIGPHHAGSGGGPGQRHPRERRAGQ